jgi:DNA-binding IclR family transcriptional regulator
MKNRPAYAIASVDNALRLATVLQLEGPVSVSEAAERLGVGRSTAHRLLAMLCYRDFAVQADDRRYRPGPVLAPARTSAQTMARIRSVAMPHLAELTDAVEETANLSVLSGFLTRFVASVECRQTLRVTTREGMAFPAHRTSGGLAMLASLPRDDVEDRFAAADAEDLQGESLTLASLHQQLAAVRNRGFALNNGRTERGIVAIGMAVTDPAGGLAGISLAMPSVRFSRDRIPHIAQELSRAKTAVERDLRRDAGG